MATAREIFGRAIQKGLAVLGEPSLLDGQPCGNVPVMRGVQVFAGALDQANDNAVVRADVAIIEKAYSPRVGQRLRHATEGTMQLTRLADDDGFTRKFVVVQMPRTLVSADLALTWDAEA